MQDSNVVITRSQVGQWASYLGSSSLLIGIVGSLLFGGFNIFTVAALVIGLVGLVVWAVIAPQDFKNVITGRQIRYSTGAFFSTLMLIAIVALTYILALRAVITLDMTAANRFTLSDETRALLTTLDRPVQMTGFYTVGNLNQREIDDQFYRQYAALNERIRIVYIDPQEEPGIAESFGVTQDGSVYLSYLNEDGTIDLSSVIPVEASDQQERSMSTAFARLQLQGRFVVYFVTSNGTLDPLDNQQQGMSLFNNQLREIGYVTQALNLTEIAQTNGSIPQNASVVVIARPTQDFQPQEIAVLDAYLSNGGGLLILADMLFTENAPFSENSQFNTYLWERYGLRGIDAVIVEAAEVSAQTQIDIYAAQVFANIPMAEGIDPQVDPTTSPLFHITRVLEVNDAPPANVNNGRVIMSSQFSYGERDLQTLANTSTFAPQEGTDIDPPLTSVAWALNQTNGSAVVMAGDGDFATNGYYSRGTGNSRLLINSIGWLSGYSNLQRVTFPPSAVGDGLITTFVSIEQLDGVAFATSVLLPGVVLLAGVLVWRKRISGR